MERCPLRVVQQFLEPVQVLYQHAVSRVSHLSALVPREWVNDRLLPVPVPLEAMAEPLLTGRRRPAAAVSTARSVDVGKSPACTHPGTAAVPMGEARAHVPYRRKRLPYDPGGRIVSLPDPARYGTRFAQPASPYTSKALSLA
ncbi:hypothetical protein GCM10018773_28280 [Streptomyces candidus]|nr:hypothetical protein GCM10018773_28280 [Streptomyces candidus]